MSTNRSYAKEVIATSEKFYPNLHCGAQRAGALTE